MLPRFFLPLLLVQILPCLALAGVDIYEKSPLYRGDASLPESIQRSDRYAVTIEQQGHRYDPFVHLSRARTEGPGSRFVQGRTVSWTDFSLTGTANVSIKLQNEGVETATVYPLRHGIHPVVEKGVVSFRIPGPGQYLVTIGGDGFDHALAIFANPPESAPPHPGDAGLVTAKEGTDPDLEARMTGGHTLYFGPGIYYLDREIVLPANIRRVYIAGGAVVFGAFQVDHDNVTIDGRGLISGVRMAHKEHHMIESSGKVRGTVVEGVTVADFPYFAVRLLGSDSSIRRVKTIGAWIYNCDGFVAWARSTMRDSFIMANDDAIKLYDSNVSVQDCITWNLTNGASLQLGWSSLEAHEVHVDGLDVIRAEWRPEGTSMNNGVINLRLGRGGANTQSRWVFENIRVDTPVLRIIDLRMVDPRKNRRAEHHVSDFLFRNIEARMLVLPDNPNNLNYILPCSEEYGFTNLRFENLSINDVPITEENAETDGRFVIDPMSRPEVSFTQTRP